MNYYFWIGLGVFIVIDFVVLLLVLSKMQKRKFSTADKKVFQHHWQNIRSGLDLKHAVMDADKLLDAVLKKKGYSGSLGDKLKAARPLFSDIDGVWAAHKLRNQLAHELSLTFDQQEARKALNHFERALRDLGVF